MTGERRLARSPRASLAGVALSLAGLGVSGYLTFEHFTASSTLACPATGAAIDCLKVTSSSYSQVLGVPVAVLGLVFFAVMAVLQIPRAWANATAAVRIGRLLWAVSGLMTALWLVYAELFRIDAICLWCTAVHTLVLMIFAVTAVATAAGVQSPSPGREGAG